MNAYQTGVTAFWWYGIVLIGAVTWWEVGLRKRGFFNAVNLYLICGVLVVCSGVGFLSGLLMALLATVGYGG